jgi:hypothetical protein
MLACRDEWQANCRNDDYDGAANASALSIATLHSARVGQG